MLIGFGQWEKTERNQFRFLSVGMGVRGELLSEIETPGIILGNEKQ